MEVRPPIETRSDRVAFGSAHGVEDALSVVIVQMLPASVADVVELSAHAEGMTKADLYPILVDRARAQYAEQNHLHNLIHRGYSALPPHGLTHNPYRFYRRWK
jgi:hypothetical protein